MPMFQRLAIVILLGASLLLVVQPVTPVSLAYVTSDSMEPTLAQGDAFLVMKTTDVRPGDIITFYSVRVGDHVTHRVVGASQEGYVTKGDNNPTTDQASGFPYVTKNVILGKALTVNGRPVVLPSAGGLIEFVRQHRPALIAALVLVFLVTELAGMNANDRHRVRRGVIYSRDFIQPIFIAGVLIGLLAVTFGSHAYTMTYVATEGDATAPHTLPVGEATTQELTVDIKKLPVSTVLVEAQGMDPIARSVGGSTLYLSARFPPPAEPGPVQTVIRVYSYPATLPRPVLEALHDVHWIVAALGSLGVVFAPFMVVYFLVVDGDAMIRWQRIRWLYRMTDR